MIICMGAGDITKWAAGAGGRHWQGEGAANERRRRPCRTVRGKLTADAPLAPLVWFKSGGEAEWLFEPADVDDLAAFLARARSRSSRHGARPRLQPHRPRRRRARRRRPSRQGVREDRAGRRDHLELRRRRQRHPRLLDGARRRHRGARIPARNSRHGRRLRAHERRRLRPRGQGHPGLGQLVLRSGEIVEWPLDELGYTYRHSDVPEGAVVVDATFRGTPGEPEAIGAEMDAIARAREESQPLRSRTGGSTFKNPPGHKAWALIDAAGLPRPAARRRPSLGKTLQFPAQSR